MELAEVVKQLFGTEPFTTSMLISLAPSEDLPPMVRVAGSQGGDMRKSLGWALRRDPKIKNVGTRLHSIIWQLDES